VVAILIETMAVAVDTIKEFGCLSTCLVLLHLGHHLSFPNKKILEAMTPLMMPFVQGILYGMHLLILQETQKVCC
jgi:hypothetical protein